jgi:hypothetical protein
MKTKLLKSIQAASTGRRVALPNPIASVSFTSCDPETIDIIRGVGQVIRVEVRLGATAVIPEEELLSSKERAASVIEHEKRRISKHIANHVYGEVRDKLRDLAMELRKRDYSYNDPALDIIYELLDMTEY